MFIGLKNGVREEKIQPNSFKRRFSASSRCQMFDWPMRTSESRTLSALQDRSRLEGLPLEIESERRLLQTDQLGGKARGKVQPIVEQFESEPKKLAKGPSSRQRR